MPLRKIVFISSWYQSGLHLVLKCLPDSLLASGIHETFLKSENGTGNHFAFDIKKVGNKIYFLSSSFGKRQLLADWNSNKSHYRIKPSPKQGEDRSEQLV